ncbi:hypothetical protein CHS0354_035873 [Potamilus streckersoni]|uniref:Uncharacterized protein n=1 Tax=Potamilus streckersoni TaxID=2493646 RepID=A0AAE0VUA4_9BIVA|nr:hypothetical protein CHS0354_035873 [Potamilus streckersoni]
MATSNEDQIASDAAEDIEPNVSVDLNCTLCLKIFRSPRRLPCSHSFCQDCLQSHISHSTSVKDTFKEFYCPICETGVRSGEEIALDKWVYLFPHNTLILSVVTDLKFKSELVCDVCQALDMTYPAKEMCIVCEQAFCENCSKMHRYLRLTNTHAILKVDEFSSKQNIVLRENSMFKCVDHAHNPLELYCRSHEVQLCSKCFTSKHKSCSDVVDLNNEAPNISDIFNDVKVQIQELEDQYKRVTDINVSNLRQLDLQVGNLIKEILALKKSINTVLDDLETRVKIECEKIYNDERNKLEKLNLGFKSQIISIRNLNCITESVCKFSTQSQTFLLAKQIMSQLSLSKSQIDKKYSENAILKLELEINPQLRSIMSIPRGDIAEMKMTRNDEKTVIAHGFKSLKGCMVEAVDVKNIQSHGDEFPRLSCYPWQLCAVGQSEIAVSVPGNRTIKFLSVKDNIITHTREVRTRHKCYGIAIVSQDEMILSGPCGEHSRYYWSLVNLDGKEKSYHEFDGEGDDHTYVALNTFKTRIYISVYRDNSLHCFGFDGKKYFTFKHKDLDGTQNIAIDRDDNVYVVGSDSHNIFQLSADGVLIQIITDVIPNDPMAMRLNEDGDRFLLTCYDSKDLHEFKMVLT